MSRKPVQQNGMTGENTCSFGKIIQQHRLAMKLSQEELGGRIGVGKNAVGAWENGRSRPDISSVPALCHILKIPYSVFFGADEPLRSASDEKVLSRYHRLNMHNRNYIMKEMDLLFDLQVQKETVMPVMRPLKQIYMNDVSAAAGFCYGLEENGGEQIWVVKDELSDKADEIIRVNGQSMSPVFENGDRVFVKHTRQIRPGEVGIFVIGNTGYIKEYQKEGLVSYNPAYPMMRFGEDDHVQCIGKVLGKLHPEHIPTAEEIDVANEQHISY